ncbi:conserved exported hypothetical protein [Syntrophobacter sp. SbD1]|nr:conserved exported hypothetical protein [Syntrophobacter sp. SbD1]
MTGKTAIFLFIAIFAVLAGTVAAEELFGIEVYPGAKADPETTKFLQENLKVNGAAFRTNDPVEKVTDFYKNQPNLKAIGILDESAVFKKGDSVELTIQNPWRDMKTSRTNNDTLISIVSQ